MMRSDDLDLLRLYAKSRSGAAFTELVRRRLNLVYSAAARIAGNELAQDVAQRVFTELAQRADERSCQATRSGALGWDRVWRP
jgi:hypothetical protein